jgi:hypothetical protein
MFAIVQFSGFMFLEFVNVTIFVEFISLLTPHPQADVAPLFAKRGEESANRLTKG